MHSGLKENKITLESQIKGAAHDNKFMTFSLFPKATIDQTTEKLKPRPSATCSYLKLNQQNGIEAFDDNSGVIGEVFLLAMGSRATAEATASHSR